jgi:hypothetical protein
MKINDYVRKVVVIVKRFYQTEEEFQDYYEKLKLTMCPHCNTDGCLILHGYLYGYSETDTSVIRRGHRIYCSNRNRKKGCGRTFSILVSVFIKDFITSANSLWLFLKEIREEKSLMSTFRESGSAIGQASIYRLFKRFRHNQVRIRSYLTRIKDPPDLKHAKIPAIQTILHLKSVFKKNSCPVAKFQHYFQASFL